MVVPDVAAAIELLNAQLRPDDVVLVKASRSAGLERVAAGLLAGGSGGGSGTTSNGGPGSGSGGTRPGAGEGGK
jgi:UDP-N-acetylmuramoyl-tripeptide--D-alanyl-D-alanine ligase